MFFSRGPPFFGGEAHETTDIPRTKNWGTPALPPRIGTLSKRDFGQLGGLGFNRDTPKNPNPFHKGILGI